MGQGNLRTYRRGAGFTQNGLARLLNVAPSTVGRWERGETVPYPYHITRLCVALEKSPSELGFTVELEEELMQTPNADESEKHRPKEQPSTYFVADRSNGDELHRLAIQDYLTTVHMGEILPEQHTPEAFRQVLDVACGTGGWLIEVAKSYPAIERLAGVDISTSMISYARQRANAEGLTGRVEFHTMDALRMLEFPAETFDLVNQRFGMSYLRTWDWPKLLLEFRRILRRGGIIRLSESDASSTVTSSSSALMQLNALFSTALFKAGHYFTEQGVTDSLPLVLQQHGGCREVQTRVLGTEFRSGTEIGDLFIQDVEKLYRNARPFLAKWVNMDGFEGLYSQMVQDLHKPSFYMTGKLVTVWGRVP